MNLFIACILMYLYASIPFSLLVGLFIYNTDIRQIGSGNVGGTNLGRACGKRAFIYGFILDGSKGAMAVAFGSIFNVNPIILLFFALLGHTFSIFIKFKGGKGVATAFGFVLTFTTFGALVAITAFLICLKISKYVSLSSLVGIAVYLIYAIIAQLAFYYLCLIGVVFVLITWAHRENIKRIKAGTESKITWM